jgi:tetratricopeptide (TPR) repeat protein
LFYYDTSLSCTYDFHICKTNFWSYFWPEEDKNTWTGTQDITVSYKSLIWIENAIVNYQNFKVDDVYLKDAYIIWAWYSNGFYNLSAHMGEQLLTEKINYKPILKIVAQSYYELWEYEKSRDVLWKYYEIDDEDAAVAYLLWIVNSKLREYVLSNIYFNKALNVWYKDTSDIYRQLIHNFYVLENDENMLESFVSLIEETEFTQNDLSLGIYYHIIHEEYAQAIAWSKKWIELFWTETGNFHTYQWWILTERWEYEEAKVLLQEWLDIESDNPFILINFAYNALARWKQWEALIYFKKVISVSGNSEFTITAEAEIEKLSQK